MKGCVSGKGELVADIRMLIWIVDDEKGDIDEG